MNLRIRFDIGLCDVINFTAHSSDQLRSAVTGAIEHSTAYCRSTQAVIWPVQYRYTIRFSKRSNIGHLRSVTQ